MVTLNILAKLCHKIAKKRGKLEGDSLHWSSVGGISGELMEFIKADETKPSEHLPLYTEAEEELADILITCLTELYRRNSDIAALVYDKIKFNEKRISNITK